MIFRCKRYLRKQKIIVQVFLFTSSVILLISSLQFVLISQLTSQISVFLEKQLLQTIIQKNFQNKIDTIMGEILQIGKLEYRQLLLEDDSRTLLFNFVQKHYISQFDVLRLCNSTNLQVSSNFEVDNQRQSEFLSYVELQKQFYPYTKLSSVQTYYSFTLDTHCLFIQTEEIQQDPLKQNALKAKEIMKASKMPMLLQSFIYEGQRLTEVFLKISEDTIIGKSFLQAHGIYRQLITNSKIIDLRYYFISIDGLIISNTQNDDYNSQYFQNSNISGFNQDQFQHILKNSLSYPGNNCGYEYKQDIYCLQDSYNNTQLIYSSFTTSTELILMILDGQDLQKIQLIFKQEFQYIMNSAIQYNYLIIGIFLVVCFMIQYLLIYLLNRPLLQIQQIAQYQISNSQRIWNILRINKQQSQIQKLCDSFYNLIYINQKLNKKIPYEYTKTIYDQYTYNGWIWNRCYKQQPIFETYKKINEIQQI